MKSQPRRHNVLPENAKKLITRLPAIVLNIFKNKTAQFADSSRMREEALNLDWNESAARTVIADIEDMLRRAVTSRPAEELFLSPEDVALAEEITVETNRAGASNITRTAAYLACFEAYPELHWAFLAHMVSRNAGWNMTDLSGSRMADIIDTEEIRLTYRFLERNNALIFQDAYPQLLLYMKSRERGASYFHLLPYFHVSRFMRPFWERFWIDRGSTLLTVGLIINEQNYIEKRVVRHPYFQKYVTGKTKFHLFSLAGLNQVVFPLLEREEGGKAGEPTQSGAAGSGPGGQECVSAAAAAAVAAKAGSARDERAGEAGGATQSGAGAAASGGAGANTSAAEGGAEVCGDGGEGAPEAGYPGGSDSVEGAALPGRAAAGSGAAQAQGAAPEPEPGPAAEWEVHRLAGRVVSDFGSLPARIALGKSLYAMLMGYRAVRSGAERFAASVPHSGSRADYWPGLFTANKEEALTAGRQASELLQGETLPAGERLYSPKLLSAWGDTPYEPISREDWLKDHSALDGISAPKRPFLCDISREHRGGILETALIHDALGDS
ncbi:DUF2515 family protein [Paenibacillus macerans]|uniref:DUF2515 family protein n=1 Tax=Paenibacillus macerans TaxID=44252 RepID=UPI0037C688B5